MSIDIITTSDGSHSLLNTNINETYHSVHGAIRESTHVFIKHGFEFAIQKLPKTISILEVGFGTGLNALLTLRKAMETPVIVEYTSLEPFPLEKEIWSSLNFTESLGLRDEYFSIHQAEWNCSQRISDRFYLTKLKEQLEKVELPKKGFSLIYFDAFAPNKQPNIWTIDVLDKVTKLLESAGTFVTYCAKGQVKRDLKALGLKVESLPGPPGKKEMIRAVKH